MYVFSCTLLAVIEKQMKTRNRVILNQETGKLPSPESYGIRGSISCLPVLLSVAVHKTRKFLLIDSRMCRVTFTWAFFAEELDKSMPMYQGFIYVQWFSREAVPDTELGGAGEYRSSFPSISWNMSAIENAFAVTKLISPMTELIFCRCLFRVVRIKCCTIHSSLNSCTVDIGKRAVSYISWFDTKWLRKEGRKMCIIYIFFAASLLQDLKVLGKFQGCNKRNLIIVESLEIPIFLDLWGFEKPESRDSFRNALKIWDMIPNRKRDRTCRKYPMNKTEIPLYQSIELVISFNDRFTPSKWWRWVLYNLSDTIKA